MIRCAIVDDEPTARDILELHIQDIPDLEVAGLCKNAMELLRLVARETIDLIFLDIHMPEVSGLVLASSLDKNIKIIFTTAHREYAIQGFDLQAVDYLLKPISPERLRKAVDKYIRERGSEHEGSNRQQRFIDISSDRRVKRVPTDEIMLIESLNDFVIVHCKEEQIKTRMNISTMEELIGSGFIRTHRSYIVNKAYVKAYNKEYVQLEGREIPLSRKYKESALLMLKGN
ncbi:LytR/AlgR family response regulator transcription factor [Roseivirga sp.]|uniref:LytR/AlgR family response regulator transcription factor n=1 Tax=Roseivirga sp. TaxID=1964215 RepID=UPI003B51ADB0